MNTQLLVHLDLLKVRRFRHLSKPAELTLSDGPVLLLGRNGTGKTNLLKLVDAITRLDFQAFESDPKGLDISFRLRWESLTLTMNLAWDPPVRDGPRRSRSRFSGTAEAVSGERVAFEVGPGKAKGGHPLAEGEETPDPFDPLFRMRLVWFLATGSPSLDPSEGGEPDTWLAPALPQMNTLAMANGRFDEALQNYEIATSASSESHASILTLDKPGVLAFNANMVPIDLARALARREHHDRLEPVGEEIPWLAKAAAACGFDRLEVQTRPLREVQGGEGQTNRTYAPFTWFAQRGSSRFSHHDFSFGQKRIVAAFWYLCCVRDFGGVAVADELVNGLHHEALRVVLEHAEGLQAYLASQNPLLFDFMEYASAEDFQHRIIRCDPDPDGWSWRNPNPDEAARFLEAYDKGYQQVSEILRAEGLW